MKPGEIIGILAEMRGINLRQLAIKANIPYNTLYAIVKRKSERIEIETLQRIANALELHISTLVGYFADGEADTESDFYKKIPNNFSLRQIPSVAANRVKEAIFQMTEEGQNKVADYAEDILPRYRAQTAPEPPAESTGDTDTPQPKKPSEGP